MTRQTTVTGGMPARELMRASLTLSEVDTTDTFTWLEGLAAPYGEWGNRGYYLESFGAGLFDKSIKEAAAKLPLLLFHDDLTWPIGHAHEWKSDADGLRGRWKLDSSTEAQRAARMARDGHMTSMSVGYQPELSRWDWADVETWDPDDAATLDKVTRLVARLAETSLVPAPLLAGAQVSMVASAGYARETTSRARASASRTPKLDAWAKIRSTL
jgi:HK97 family phage prohead protease